MSMKALGISSSGRKAAFSKIIVKDILEESGVPYEMIDHEFFLNPPHTKR